MRQLLALTLCDLRQRIRDTSVLIFGLVVPLSLMAVLNLVVGGAMDPDVEDLDVGLSIAGDDPIREPLLTAFDTVDVAGLHVTESSEQQVREQVQDGSLDLGVIVPPDFTAQVLSGQAPVVTVVDHGGAGLSGAVVRAVVQGVVDHLAAGSEAARAGAEAGLSPDEAGALVAEVAGASTPFPLTEATPAPEQLSPSAALVAGQAGLFLIFTVGFGALALLADRENGTLTRLHSMPMPRSRVVWAKALVSFLLGVFATSILLAVGGRLFGADFGSIPAVGLLIVCAVVATTSLMFIVIRVARTAEQAGMAQSILALVLGVAGGAFFPLSAGGPWADLLDLNPVAAFTRGLGITAGGGGITDLGVPVLYLLGFALVCGTLARILPDKGVAA